mmetsp:Transcript_4100/g.7864  ORF Transcript_4100/g.7864 Transcript_4100/m.7864 type:complete len:775 (+) Transcript_4100:111-2435(+)
MQRRNHLTAVMRSGMIMQQKLVALARFLLKLVLKRTIFSSPIMFLLNWTVLLSFGYHCHCRYESLCYIQAFVPLLTTGSIINNHWTRTRRIKSSSGASRNSLYTIATNDSVGDFGDNDRDDVDVDVDVYVDGTVGTALLQENVVEPSAFGKAAIGKNKMKRRKTDANHGIIRRITTTRSSRNGRNSDDISSAANNTITTITTQHSTNTLRTAMSTKQVIKRRNMAIQALTQHLYLTQDATRSILNRHPRLYTHLHNLNDRLSYLLNDLHLTRQTLKKMLLHHPRLMEKVFLDSELNIASTMQVLEKEIGLDKNDVISMQLQKGVTSVLSYPRSELRKRILIYKNDLGYSEEEMRQMVRKDPRMLQTSSFKVKRLLEVLRQELLIGSEDVKEMIKREILLLTYDAEKNILPTIQYLKNGPVGRCLGMVERKGESTLLNDLTVEDKERLIRERVKALVMGHPKVLSCSLERNLKPTVHFFWDCGGGGGGGGGGDGGLLDGTNVGGSDVSPTFTSVVGLTDYEFGKVLYRRGGSLLEANVERTLIKKVNFLRQELGLEICGRYNDKDDEGVLRNDNFNELANMQNGWNRQKVEIPLPKSLVVQEQYQGALGTDISLSPYECQRLLAQMIATAPDILTLSIETNLKPKFEYFCNTLKFEKDELRYVILKRPQILSLNLDRNILPKIEFLVKERTRIDSYSKGPNSYNGGLGMSMKEVRDWIVQHPQILTFGLEKRIRPRVFDIVYYNLNVGDGEGDAPMNCISRSEQSWKQWIQSNVV